MKKLCSLWVMGLALAAGAAGPSVGETAASDPLRIYIDADYSIHGASAVSIERGLRVALSEVGNKLQGRPVEVVPLDHRGNTTRSKLNYDKAFADPNTLLIMAGIHSPPLIKNRQYINDNQMLTLVPWAAGGPITRHPSADNWVFRLSVDDTKAGYRIARHAIEAGQCAVPHLLLEQTPWGASNHKTMTDAIVEQLEVEPAVTWFNWGISQSRAQIILRDIKAAGGDCLLFVGNSIDGGTFAKASLVFGEAERLAIFSHWGITGGQFFEKVVAQNHEHLSLRFIQTCFSFVSSPSTPLVERVFARAQKLFPSVQTRSDIKAPPGFIHAYDLGRILISASAQISFGDDMAANRLALRGALEDLRDPVEGLIKTYEKPFSTFSEENSSAHEALGTEDFCMAEYQPNGDIVLLDLR